MSLDDRTVHFKKEFPGAKMNRTLLRKVYRVHGIKKKKLFWTKQAKDHDPRRIRQKLGTMKMLLTRARNNGYRIIYADETMFTRKTITDSEWTRKKENLSIDMARLDEPTLALLASISKENGLEHFQIFERSVNMVKFF